jgi:hypothetical protein
MDSQQTQYRSTSVSLPVQITAARHDIKTFSGVGVAAVGNTYYDVLVMVGDPANKCGNTVS